MRNFLAELDATGDLGHVRREVSAEHEIAAVTKKLDGRPLLFENVKEKPGYKVVTGVCGTRKLLARALKVGVNEVLDRVLESIDNPKPFETVRKGPCQEVVEEKVDLGKIPILTHYERDGGPYLTGSIIIARDQKYGYNASFHRLMVVGKDRVVARILPRHLDEFIKRGTRDVGITVGNHPAFLFASAVSCEIGKSELDIANCLKEMSFVKCGNDVIVPAECEIVMEGTVTDEFVDEGPFPDIVGAYDIVRKQRMIRINRVTHRENPIYQAILPGGIEHKFLMGTPREATIFREVKAVCDCLDVRLTSGGSSWLHGVVKIRKTKERDARNAMDAAFKGHPSLKHVVVVDDDINIESPEEVEWAVATRTQLDKGLVLRRNELGSSLDPSADQVSRRTCKAGIDATIPLGASRDGYVKAKIPMEDMVAPEEYLR